MEKLTPSELEIMKLLWREDRPLSAQEILNLTPERSWSPNSLYPMLQHLQEKHAVAVVGFVPVGRKYARTYLPAVTESAYCREVMGAVSTAPDPLSIFRNLLDSGEITGEQLKEMERLIREYRESRKP